MRTITRVSRTTLAMAVALLIAVAVTTAQGNRFEKDVPFVVDTSVALDAVVGPVKVTTLKVTNLGRGYGRGGFGLRTANPPSELSTTLRFAFDVDNPTDDEWDVTFTVELLDKSGQVIDRGSKKENYEDEAKVLNLEHSIIEYVLPLVSQVRVTLEGRRS
jgi:hypothetical protein